MTTNKCRDCRFFEAGDRTNENRGTCKRRAPQVYGQHGNSKWPATHGHWWCGEFVPTVLTEVGSGFRELTEKAPQVALSTTQDRIDADMATQKKTAMTPIVTIMSKLRCGGEVVIAVGGKITGTPYCSKCRLLLPWDQVSKDDFNYIHQAPNLKY